MHLAAVQVVQVYTAVVSTANVETFFNTLHISINCLYLKAAGCFNMKKSNWTNIVFIIAVISYSFMNMKYFLYTVYNAEILDMQ